MARLIFYCHQDELFRVNLTRDVLRVGRGPDNDVLVSDPAVSRKQFCIEKSGTSWVIQDLSRKGPEVDGQVVGEANLRNKSEIRLSEWRAVFELSPEEDDETTHKEGAGRTAQRAREPAYGVAVVAGIVGDSSHRTDSARPDGGRRAVWSRCFVSPATGAHLWADRCIAAHNLG